MPGKVLFQQENAKPHISHIIKAGLCNKNPISSKKRNKFCFQNYSSSQDSRVVLKEKAMHFIPLHLYS